MVYAYVAEQFIAHSSLENGTHNRTSIFVAHCPELPPIGLQDRYTAQFGHAVTRLLPADTPLLAQCWERQAATGQLEAGAELTKAVDFVARHIAPQTVGIAFGVGGARTAARLGVL